jgi:tetratricopeptide (TPR) repeat protein
MIFAEIVLLIAIIGLFIMVARKLPDAIKENRQEANATSQVQLEPDTQSKPRFKWPWQRSKTDQSIITETVSLPPEDPGVQNPTNEIQRETLLSDDALLNEGDDYLQSGKFKEAERAYLRGVAKNPKNPRLYNRLGAIYLKQRNYRDALEAFEAARDFDGSKASRHYNVALAAWQLGRLAKAREAIAMAIKLEPESVKYQDLRTQMEQQ